MKFRTHRLAGHGLAVAAQFLRPLEAHDMDRITAERQLVIALADGHCQTPTPKLSVEQFRDAAARAGYAALLRSGFGNGRSPMRAEMHLAGTDAQCDVLFSVAEPAPGTTGKLMARVALEDPS